MPMIGIRQRVSERRLSRGISFRRSDPGTSTLLSSSPDKSEHHGSEMSTVAPPAARRRQSRRSSFASSVLSHGVDILPIDPATQSLAVAAAEEKKSEFRESLPRSLLIKEKDCIAPFKREEIILGPKLGSGEYGNVFEVSSFKYDACLFADNSTTAFSIEELDRRLAMKKGEKYRETKKARYALKSLKPEYHQENSAQAYIQATSDLVFEAEILASLQHPNIIKLRGIAQAGAAAFEYGSGEYFLVIDRLFETLDQRMRRWRSPGRKSRFHSSIVRSVSALPSIPSLSKMPSSALLDFKTKENEVMDERLNIAFQISAAMKYLHTHRIMYRDLKPMNIGFDVRGDVKIFDFGLSRVFPDEGDGNFERYEMSGAGSPRYMAPECLKNEAYNFKADVYSFSIVVWELLSGKTPYAFVRRTAQLIQHVVHEDIRPEIDCSWPSAIQGMLESSFDPDICKRPKMSLWYDIIRETLVGLRGGDQNNLSESWVSRRRSFGSTKDLSAHHRSCLKHVQEEGSFGQLQENSSPK